MREVASATISCVVPAYNEAANLGVLLPRLQAVLAQTGASWEIVVVDDGPGVPEALRERIETMAGPPPAPPPPPEPETLETVGAPVPGPVLGGE